MKDEKPRGPLYYASYLQLDRLLGSQEMQSALHGRPAHDEMLFIIVHQAYELWFKQILHEIDAAIVSMNEDRSIEAVRALRRVVEIDKLLIAQIHILETMSPCIFWAFVTN